VSLIGALDTDDLFHVENNDEGVGDGRAMFELAGLQTGESRNDGRGGFQKIFNTTVSRLGAMVRTSELSAEASVALKDASLEAEASFSGVNLDSEAANLIEQQQAYQASARILTTARELFETLLGL
jgi:flagellar hook-associated protein 1 FlgK